MASKKNVLSRYQIRFSWPLSLIFGVLFSVFIVLAIWQWQRAEEKLQVQLRMDELLQQSVVQVDKISAINPERFLAVRVEGHYLKEQSFLLDNVVKKGKAGYQVMTPFRLQSSGEILLVNRGWVAGLSSRTELPSINTPEDKQTIDGWLQRPRSQPAFLVEMETPEIYQPGIWQYVDIGYLARKLSEPVVEWVINLSPEQPYGYVRESPVFDAKVGMHYGYFLHWLVFALFSVAAYLTLIIKRREQ